MTVQNMTYNVKLDTTDYIQNVQSVTMGNHSAEFICEKQSTSKQYGSKSTQLCL